MEIVVPLHAQGWHADALQIVGEVRFRERLDAVVVSLRAVHHALAPPVINDAIQRLGVSAVDVGDPKMAERDVLSETITFICAAAAGARRTWGRTALPPPKLRRSWTFQRSPGQRRGEVWTWAAVVATDVGYVDYGCRSHRR